MAGFFIFDEKKPLVKERSAIARAFAAARGFPPAGRRFRAHAGRAVRISSHLSSTHSHHMFHHFFFIAVTHFHMRIHMVEQFMIAWNTGNMRHMVFWRVHWHRWVCWWRWRSNWRSIWGFNRNWGSHWWFFHVIHFPFLQDFNVSYDWGNESVPNVPAQLCLVEWIGL
jgi:hypothetical protein